MAKPKQDDPKQAAHFRKAARELGCEPDEARFQDALREIAKHKPVEHAKAETSKKPKLR